MNSLLKTCPSCGTENEQSDILCRQCGADISAVPVADAKKTTDQSQSPLTTAQPPSNRICPHCNNPNPTYAILCGSCGAERPAMAPPASPVSGPPLRTEKEAAEEIKMTINGNEFLLRDQDILGREGTVAKEFFVAAGQTVSRRHAVIGRKNKSWWITSLSANKTALDGQVILRGESMILAPGIHSLQLSSKCTVNLQVV